MFDATKLLERLLGPQNAATAQGYIDQGTRAVEGLVGADTVAKGKDLLGQGLSSLQQTADQLLGPDTLAKTRDLVGEGLSSLEAGATQTIGAERIEQAKTLVKENQLATGAVVGGLLGLLVGTETGRKVGGTALEVGTLAALGGLAWKAWQNWQTQSAAPGAPAADPCEPTAPATPAAAPTPADPAAEQKLAAATIIAMIQAAKADGHLDDAERAAILARVGDMEGPAKTFLDTELAAPVDVDRVADLAGNEQEAVHLYAASLLAIDPDQPIERAYLAALAQKLRLGPDLVTEIERGVRRT